jgi:hypothetical protein
MNTQTLLLSLLAWVLSLLPAQADVAPEPMSGGISLEVPGNGQTKIALLHNTVKLHISPRLCKTRAFFRLYNMGEATELEVGFPLIYEGEAADFKVLVDDEPVAFEDRTKEDKTPVGQPYTRRWKMWRMSFNRSQTHLVEVRYSNTPVHDWSAKLSDTGTYPAYYQWRATGKDYNIGDFGYKERIELREWVIAKAVRYILVTGSYWKGPVERCRVEVDMEGITMDSIVEVRPPAQSFSPQQIVWEWKNVEPAHNIALIFVGGVSPRQTIIPYLEKIAAHHPQDEKLQDTLRMMKQDFAEEKIRERQKSFVQR